MSTIKREEILSGLSRRNFVIATTVVGMGITMFGCKKADQKPSDDNNPAPAHPAFKVTDLSIPSKVTFIKGASHTFMGSGFAVGDKITFVSAVSSAIVFTLTVDSITSTSCTFLVPLDFSSALYRMTVSRGSQTLSLGSSTIQVLFREVPDLSGKNVKGTVYAGATPLANVMVSDGEEVTTTDQDGVYYLASKKTKSFVFISIPSGYEVTLKNSILPQFYKNFESNNINIIESIDFELTPVNNDKHIMLALGDMHLAGRNDDVDQFKTGFLVDAKASISKYKNEGYKVYGLTLGDMSWETYWYANNFGLSNYLETMKPIDIPIFHTMGNHDNDPYIAEDWSAEHQFRGNLGPTYYSFNIGKIHYIVLDDIEYINTGGASGTSGSRNYNGVVVADQLAWLQKDLATITDKNITIVVAMHINLNSNPTLSGQNETASLRLTGASNFINMFSSFNDVHVITGHTHYSFNYQNTAKLMEHNTTAICATWWWTGRSGYANNQISKDGTPGGYEIWKFNNRDYQWRYKSIGYDENYQFRAYDLNRCQISAGKYAPKANATFAAKVAGFAAPYDIASTANEILVNVWNYDKQWTVEVLENGIPLTVSRVRTKDPLHIISYEMLRLNVNTDPTDDFVSNLNAHFFKAKANSATSTITIKVTDRFGNIYSETMTRPKELTTSMR